MRRSARGRGLVLQVTKDLDGKRLSQLMKKRWAERRKAKSS